MLQFINENGIINLFIIIVNYLYAPDTEEREEEPDSDEDDPYCEQSTENNDELRPDSRTQEIELTQLNWLDIKS